jgi:hypothetical protein
MRILTSAVFICLATICVAQESPVLEFLRKEKKNFTSEGHPKSKDIHLTMEYPGSWLAEEGNRPNVVQKFTSEGGKGLEIAVITIVRIPIPANTDITSADIDDALSVQSLKDMAPEGARTLVTRRTKIDNQPTGYAECVFTQERANKRLLMYMQSYVIYYEGRLIIVQYQIGDIESAESLQLLETRRKAFAPLFDQMANSLIIHNQYSRAEKNAVDPFKAQKSVALVGSVYASTEFQFSLTFPYGWRVEQPQNRKHKRAIGASVSGISSNLSVRDVPFQGTLAEFVADHRRYLQSRPGFREISQEPFITASGIHGVVIRCTVKDNEVPVRTNFDCYYFERSPSLKFLLMAYCAADARDQIQPLFDDAVRTFRFTEVN